MRINKIVVGLFGVIIISSLVLLFRTQELESTLEMAEVSEEKIFDSEQSIQQAEDSFSSDTKPQIELRALNQSRNLTPIELYIENIDLANEASAVAQYRVSQALKSCEILSDIKSNADLGRERSNFDRSNVPKAVIDEVMSRLETSFEGCKELLPFVGSQDVRELHDAWLETSAHNGNPLAELETIFIERGRILKQEDIETVRSLIYESLDQFQSEDVLEMERVLTLTATFVNRPIKSEVESTAGERDYNSKSLKSFAWSYLTCRYKADCSEEEFQTTFGNSLYPYQLSEVVSTANQYDESIKNKDWQSLDLN